MEKDQKPHLEGHIPPFVANILTAALNGLSRLTGIEDAHIFWDNGIEAGFTRNGHTHTIELKKKSST